jgi:DNA-binding transcriptional LysR family regulator
MAEYDIVGPQHGSCLDQLMIRVAASLGRPLKARIRVNGFEKSSSMVEAGLGVALVSEHHALRRAASGQLTLAALTEPWAVRQWKICSRDPKALPAPARLRLDHLSAPAEARAPLRITPNARCRAASRPRAGARGARSRALKRCMDLR